MGILRSSALYAPTFDKKLGKMLQGDYAAANFPTKVPQHCILQDVKLPHTIRSSLHTTMPHLLFMAAASRVG